MPGDTANDDRKSTQSAALSAREVRHAAAVSVAMRAALTRQVCSERQVQSFSTPRMKKDLGGSGLSPAHKIGRVSAAAAESLHVA